MKFSAASGQDTRKYLLSYAELKPSHFEASLGNRIPLGFKSPLPQSLLELPLTGFGVTSSRIERGVSEVVSD